MFSVSILLVRIMDYFVQHVLKITTIVVQLVVLQNLNVVFSPIVEECLPSLRAVDSRVTVAVKKHEDNRLSKKIIKTNLSF